MKKPGALKNWYTKRSNALAPGPPPRVVRFERKEPKPPVKTSEVCAWSEAQRKRQRYIKHQLWLKLKKWDEERKERQYRERLRRYTVTTASTFDRTPGAMWVPVYRVATYHDSTASAHY